MHIPNKLGFIMFLNIMIFSAALLMPFLHCFSTWRDEWKLHTIYHLLSLPVPRIYLLISKYCSIVLEVLLIAAVMTVGIWMQYLFSGELLFKAKPLVAFEWSKVGLVMKWLLSLTCFVFLCFLSIFIGKCCRKLALLVTFLSFVVGLLLWIIAFANYPSFLTLIIVSLVYFSASYYLLEKKVGVE
jgi:hypothetical protein